MIYEWYIYIYKYLYVSPNSLIDIHKKKKPSIRSLSSSFAQAVTPLKSTALARKVDQGTKPSVLIRVPSDASLTEHVVVQKRYFVFTTNDVIRKTLNTRFDEPLERFDAQDAARGVQNARQ